MTEEEDYWENFWSVFFWRLEVTCFWGMIIFVLLIVAGVVEP